MGFVNVTVAPVAHLQLIDKANLGPLSLLYRELLEMALSPIQSMISNIYKHKFNVYL